MASERALRKELAACEAKISAAYWRFCRCARAKPPCLAEPQAYKRRSEIQSEMRAQRKGARDMGDKFTLSNGTEVEACNSHGPSDWYAALDADELAEMVARGDAIAKLEQEARLARGEA